MRVSPWAGWLALVEFELAFHKFRRRRCRAPGPARDTLVLTQELFGIQRRNEYEFIIGSRPPVHGRSVVVSLSVCRPLGRAY